MVARLTFRSELYIDGDSIKDIKDKWEEMSIFDQEAFMKNDACVIELVSVEEDETYKDLMSDFIKA